MTGREIIDKSISLMKKFPDDINRYNIGAHTQLLEIHARTLACHCECLGMNAENSLAVCRNETPPYSTNDYFMIMFKWGLVDNNNKPKI